MQARFYIVLFTILVQGFSIASPFAPEDSVKTYFWGLIKIPQNADLVYEDGYFLDKLLHPREFSEPITFLPLEVSYGVGISGGGGEDLDLMRTGWMKFEENPPYSFDGGHIGNRIGHQLELDFLKLNLSHYILGSSWADMQTGLFFRYASVFFPPSIPDKDWQNYNPSWNVVDKTFSPRVFTLGMSHSWIYQSAKYWFFHCEYTYGIATADFYRHRVNKNYDSKPSGWGPATSYSAGLRLILDPGMKNRYAVGVDFKHVYTKINRIKDEDNVTPISRFDLANFGLFFSIDVFYGGKKTSGDKGKEYYYHRDYIKAVESFRDFLHRYPRHANRYKAERYLQKCIPKIPYQLMREGMSFDERNLIDKALDRYLKARVIATDPNMLASLQIRIDQIADKQIYDAELLMEKGYLQKALSIMEKVVTYSERGRKELPRFHARVMLRDGEVALNAGFYKKAMNLFMNALRKDTDLALEVGILQHQIAVKLVEQANQITDPEDIRLAIESLEMAEQLSLSFRKSDREILNQLKEKLKISEQIKVQSGVFNKMDETRKEIEEQRKPKAKIGMTIPEIQEILGNPSEKIHKPDVEGEDHQLWIYPMKDGKELQITFLNFIVIRVEIQ